MAETIVQPARDARPAWIARIGVYYELTKPGITAFVVLTAAASYYVGAGGAPQLVHLAHTLFGTLLGTAGALALNQYVEREVDARMHRTRTRPLPSGRMAPREALAFGALLLAVGVVYLAALVAWQPALLTAGSAAAYLWLYTPMKSRSYAATLVGAVPGAMPALIGWSAAAGSITVGGLVLFFIAFLWQLPHVLALAWLLREDYQRAGFFMTPPTDPDGSRIGKHMVYHSVSLVFMSVVPTLLRLTGLLYLVGAVALGGFMLALTAAAAVEMSRARARRVFFGSLLYQPLLMTLMFVDTLPG